MTNTGFYLVKEPEVTKDKTGMTEVRHRFSDMLTLPQSSGRGADYAHHIGLVKP